MPIVTSRGKEVDVPPRPSMRLFSTMLKSMTIMLQVMKMTQMKMKAALDHQRCIFIQAFSQPYSC
ncbi:BgTH12-02404 [Blumeria graminis f. sp. triticale]|uniref:Bgt-51426 n=2 Tax=Blumeria graminis TaxID=34373 RepID=A0A9X9QCF5_BLUGR|nr:BgTH12-02404 [Blumeria graminis f. sp. triticale]VDB86180.1 Bgt-51426 [Blumeria graminis f. sp. tritici]